VAIGVGAEGDVDAGVVAAAVLGIVVAAALWWLYFDVVALVVERRLSRAAEGKERNEIARDSFSYLHFPMIAGIVLVSAPRGCCARSCSWRSSRRERNCPR
jgi:low temperature requirement protein LtrA